MILLQLLGYFCIASVLGFGVDTTIRSIRRKRFAPVRTIPFSPLYGFGSFGFLALPASVEAAGMLGVFLYYAVAISLLEYTAGALILRLRGTRMWDYRERYLNVHGHTDVFHFFLWGTLGYACRTWLVGPVSGLVGLNV